ncbi:hypothetical protein M885DRAFT_588766 [Pelagophyceae sp. CCMP2097]|nr:hypothetical protein M885DRAFT_588766 [Pelagophyceae sp. CCMP2097]
MLALEKDQERGSALASSLRARDAEHAAAAEALKKELIDLHLASFAEHSAHLQHKHDEDLLTWTETLEVDKDRQHALSLAAALRELDDAYAKSQEELAAWHKDEAAAREAAHVEALAEASRRATEVQAKLKSSHALELASATDFFALEKDRERGSGLAGSLRVREAEHAEALASRLSEAAAKHAALLEQSQREAAESLAVAVADARAAVEKVGERSLRTVSSAKDDALLSALEAQDSEHRARLGDADAAHKAQRRADAEAQRIAVADAVAACDAAHAADFSAAATEQASALVRLKFRAAAKMAQGALGQSARQSLVRAFRLWFCVGKLDVAHAGAVLRRVASARRSAFVESGAKVVDRVLRRMMHGGVQRAWVNWTTFVYLSNIGAAARGGAKARLERILRRWKAKQACRAFEAWRLSAVRGRRDAEDVQLAATLSKRWLRRCVNAHLARGFANWTARTHAVAQRASKRLSSARALTMVTRQWRRGAASDAFSRWRIAAAAMKHADALASALGGQQALLLGWRVGHAVKLATRLFSDKNARSKTAAWRVWALRARQSQSAVFVVSKACRRLLFLHVWQAFQKWRGSALGSRRRGGLLLTASANASRLAARLAARWRAAGQSRGWATWVAAVEKARSQEFRVSQARLALSRKLRRAAKSKLRRGYERWVRLTLVERGVFDLAAAVEATAAEGDEFLQASLASQAEEHSSATEAFEAKREAQEKRLLATQLKSVTDGSKATLRLERLVSQRARRAERLCSTFKWVAQRRAFAAFYAWRMRAPERLCIAPAAESTLPKATGVALTLRCVLSKALHRRKLLVLQRWSFATKAHTAEVRNIFTASTALRRTLQRWGNTSLRAALRTWQAKAAAEARHKKRAAAAFCTAARAWKRIKLRCAWAVWAQMNVETKRLEGCVSAGGRLLERALKRSSKSMLLAAFRQWHEHYEFLSALSTALASALLRHKKTVLELRRENQIQAAAFAGRTTTFDGSWTARKAPRTESLDAAQGFLTPYKAALFSDGGRGAEASSAERRQLARVRSLHSEAQAGEAAAKTEVLELRDECQQLRFELSRLAAMRAPTYWSPPRVDMPSASVQSLSRVAPRDGGEKAALDELKRLGVLHRSELSAQREAHEARLGKLQSQLQLLGKQLDGRPRGASAAVAFGGIGWVCLALQLFHAWLVNAPDLFAGQA